jgi:murein tripeptide amidase MpaA
LQNFDYGEYYLYEELNEILHSMESNFSNLAKVYSIGKSHQDRDLWMIEITNKESGSSKEKPGYYIDGNTHPEEVSGSTVSTYIAWKLLTGYGKEDRITRLLDGQVFYILPRLNPDAAEFCLTKPYYSWHGNGRYLPGDEQVGSGLHFKDMNGDNCIVDMRIKDEKGEWKVSEKDPRIMIQREPDEYDGEYYRMVPEGYIEDFDGAEINVPRPRDGNLNRNYPYGWGPEGEQYGAGDYPMSEPEIEAVVKFVEDHPNIIGGINYHTNAGLILPPMGIKSEEIPYPDRALFDRIGEMGTEETDYEVISDESLFNPAGTPSDEYRMGTASDFFYGQKGMLPFTVELWDIHTSAGIDKDWYYPVRELSEERKLKLMKWNDKKLNGDGFADWEKFDHPQLGEVEIGGWKRLFMFRNPPAGEELKKLCEKNGEFALRHASTAPELEIEDTKITNLGDNVFKLDVIVANEGYLPTNLTERAIEIGAVDTVKVELKGNGFDLLDGTRTEDIGHLSGRSERYQKYDRFRDWGSPQKSVRWIIEAGGTKAKITVRAVSEKGGTAVTSVDLPNG